MTGSSSINFPALDRITLLHGFGRSAHSMAYLYRPSDRAQIAELLAHAARGGFTVALRGAGRSYGDAAINAGQVVLDLRRMRRVLAWDAAMGVICVEPGVTIQQLYEFSLEDGWWPPVVPGTMRPTLGGCLAMNVHGKNNYRAGPLGEHVLSFTALLPTGEEVTCSPAQNRELFYGIIGGLGVLGVFTSITLQLKRVYSGDLSVEGWAVPDMARAMADMEALVPESDYLVGWIDSLARGRALGRGQLHRARYLAPGEDAHPAQTLRAEHQALPDTLFGVLPKSVLWRFMRLVINDPGMALVNTAKYLAARSHRQRYRQSLAAFNFLLDYIPRWEEAYGRGGLIQYQSFIPRDTAAPAFRALLDLAQRRGLPAYLGVLKRHRRDAFLLTHAVDGYSLALDFRVPPRRPGALQALAGELDRIVLEAGGRFYFAKDSTLTHESVARFLGDATLARFQALKERCDPAGVLENELYRRVFAGSRAPGAGRRE